MSIVFDFPAIKAKLRGDDWWEPAKVACEPVDFRWARVNDEPFEYAVCQGPHGDEFVKLSDGTCKRRPMTDEQLRREKDEAEAFYAGAQWTPEQVNAFSVDRREHARCDG